MTALNLNALLANTPSTSGSYSFSVTRDQIIRAGMLEIGALAEGENPTAQEISDCAFKLNLLVKQWMGDTDFAPGMKVWTRKRADLFLQGNQYTYAIGQTSLDNWVDSTTGLTYPNSFGQTTLTANAVQGATVLHVAAASQFNINDQIGVLIGATIAWGVVASINVGALTVTLAAPGLSAAASANAYVWNYTNKGIRPVKLVTCVLRDIYSNDTPLSLMNLEGYESLPTKTMPGNSGDPTSILYESQFTTQQPNGQLYLDVGNPQDVTKRLHCVYLAPVQDFLNPGDAPDYPQQWYRPLVLQHAKDICGMFECQWPQTSEDNLLSALAIARQADPKVTDAFFQVNEDYQA